MIEHEGEFGIQSSEIAQNWGFIVPSVDLAIVGTQWDHLIHHAVLPELRHFAAAGVAAIAASLPPDVWEESLRSPNRTNFFAGFPEDGMAAKGSRQLYDSGTAVIGSVKAASALQASEGTVNIVGTQGTTRQTTYGLFVPREIAIAEQPEIADTFQLQGAGPLIWMGVGYDEQHVRDNELVNPKDIVFAGILEGDPRQKTHTSVYTYLRFSDNPVDNLVTIQTGRRATDRAASHGGDFSDPNFSAVKAFTCLINRTLEFR